MIADSIIPPHPTHPTTLQHGPRSAAIRWLLSTLARWLPLIGAVAILAGMSASARSALGQSTGGTGTGGTVNLALKSSIPQPSAGDLLVKDLAEITGTAPGMSPETIGQVVVIPAAEVAATRQVGIDQLRRALEAARVNLGRVTLRGSTCRIVLSAAPSEPHRTSTSSKPAELTPQPLDLEPTASGDFTIRALISSRLLDLYNVEPQDLRLGFDPGQSELLETLAAGRRIDIQPAGSGNTARIPVNIAIYTSDRLISTHVTTVQALIQREVATARESISKGRMISPEQVEVSSQWLPPGGKPPAKAESAIGSIASRQIPAGSVLTQSDIESPLACKRGDVVWVHALSGSVTVKAKARAMGAAREGETVQLKLDGSNQVFSARMSGRGIAVMLVGEQTGSAPTTGAAQDQPDTKPIRVTTSPTNTAVRPVRKSAK